MNGRDFLVLAQSLAPAATEAAWRSAASRAYYAAFHVARQFLEGLGFAVPPGEKAHAYLWLRLSNCGDPPTVQVGRVLRALRQDRGIADYNLKRAFIQTVGLNSVRLAENIIQALDAAAAGPNRQQSPKSSKPRIRCSVADGSLRGDASWRGCRLPPVPDGFRDQVALRLRLDSGCCADRGNPRGLLPNLSALI